MQMFICFLVLALLLAPAAECDGNEKRNVLLICVDDLRPELGCFGVDYIHSPNIDRLASTGRAFHSHYVHAPTCGASRYTLLTGRIGGNSNNAIFRRAERIQKAPDSVPPSMPAFFRANGYTTVSVGKVSHHPGGRGGANWDDDSKLEMPHSWDRHLLPAGLWKHPRGWMHGLANGAIRVERKHFDVLQAVEGTDSIYPDGGSVAEALQQLKQLSAADKPFFLAVGVLRPHLPFGAPAKYLKLYEDAKLPPIPHANKPIGKTTWHRSGEFRGYNCWGRDPNVDSEFATDVRKHYAACVSYADAQVGKIMEQLTASGKAGNTVVLLWGDHGWHLGEHAVWGKHTLFEESLRSPLIISYPEIKQPGVATDSMVETLDLFPTICELTGVPKPDFAHGVSLKPILDDPNSPGHTAIAYRNSQRTIRTQTHRLIVHKDGHVELYDHTTVAKETVNVAHANASLVADLTKRLRKRFQK